MNHTDHQPISKLLLAFVATWAFAESSFWFIAVDFLLIPYALTYPRQWFRIALVAWTASHVGGALYFWFCHQNLELAGSILKVTPFVTERMHNHIISIYESHGVWGAMAQSWSFMSFKIWTYEAVTQNFSFEAFFPIVMISRILRLFVVSWVASIASPWLRPVWVRKKSVSWSIYTVVFVFMLIIIEA
jgi:hypothetical protein